MANNNHFNLTLDTLAPTGSISRPKEYVNGNTALTINRGDATFMKLWFDASSTSSEPTSSWVNISTKETSFTQNTEFTSSTAEGVYYYHVIFMDSVNNKSSIYTTERIVYDTAAPEFSSVWLKDITSESTSITNDKNCYFGWTYGDPGQAGITSVVISCAEDSVTKTISNPTASYDSETKSSTTDKYFTFTGSDGTKTLTFTLTDYCGNTSSKTCTIILDTGAGDATISLFKEDGTTPLPANINYTSIKATLKSANSDIIAYKFWETGTTEPEYTTMTKGQLNKQVAHTLSSGDAVKTLNLKIKDEAENEASTSAEVTYDATNPVVTIKDESGNTLSEVKLAGTVKDTTDTGTILSKTAVFGYNADISGLDSWDLKLNGTSIKGSLTSIPSTYVIQESIGLLATADGNTLVLSVTDKAGNTGSASCKIYMDNKKPEVTINSTLSSWYNATTWESFSCTVGVTDASYSAGLGTLSVWVDTTADNTTVPSGVTAIAATATTTITKASIYGTPSQTASNYLHIKSIDAVGHFNYVHAKFGYDSVAPTNAFTAKFAKSVYSTTSAIIQFTSLANADTTSGVAKYMLAGDVTDHTSWTAISSSATEISCTLDDTEASSSTKTVKIYLQDTAGNSSGILATITTELDMTTPSATLNLYDAANKSALSNQPEGSVSVAKFTARIAGFDDGTSGAKATEYKLYGDFNYGSQQSGGTSEEAASWNTLTYDTGMQYMSIGDIYCTTNSSEGSEAKDIYVKVRDNAGNESEAVHSLFYYDTSTPEVTASVKDYNIISKQNSLRYNSSGATITGAYADTMYCTFTPSKTMQAYKVCAYINQADATKEGTTASAETPIPTAGGSEYMSATGIESIDTVTAKIVGVDLENAIKARVSDFSTSTAYAVGDLVKYNSAYYRCIAAHSAGAWNADHFHEDVDGLRIIVIYVQDMGGTWSALASFTA